MLSANEKQMRPGVVGEDVVMPTMVLDLGKEATFRPRQLPVFADNHNHFLSIPTLANSGYCQRRAGVSYQSRERAGRGVASYSDQIGVDLQTWQKKDWVV